MTQLKRINRHFKKIESQTKLNTLTMESLERKRSLLRNSPGGRSNKSIQDLESNETAQAEQQTIDVKEVNVAGEGEGNRHAFLSTKKKWSNTFILK